MQNQTILPSLSDLRCGFAPVRPWLTRLATTVAAGAMTLALVAIPVSFDATSGLPALKMAFAKSGSGSDGRGGDSDSGSHDDDDRSGHGGGDDDDRSGHGGGDDDDRSGHGGGDDDRDSFVIREIDGQIYRIRIRERDGEYRIRVRNVGADEDLLRVRLRDGEYRIRVRDSVNGEDLVRVRLRDQEGEVRVRDALTGEDLVRLRDGTTPIIEGVGYASVSVDPISVQATDDFASVQVGPEDVVGPAIVILRVGSDDGGATDDVVAVRLTAVQTDVLARSGWTVDSLDGDADGVLDADELGF